MYYTGKGDDGTTTLYGCDQRISKSSAITEALGALDEATSMIGLLVSLTGDMRLPEGVSAKKFLSDIQSHLFTIQAEVAGADKHIADTSVNMLEKMEEKMAEVIPPITSFVVPGGNEVSARTDVARTIVRRAERRVVAVVEEEMVQIMPETLRYLNRLSSFFFVLARYVNEEAGIAERPPTYDT
ncbi:MAG: cob(I)yrinic acid a,c-diamide adenosyltransferase [Parcubacteria group bacterium]|nr:cob(I)yrinic acid a,c-diamide adenosyltransferase [Parcubacteria group bacterium]